MKRNLIKFILIVTLALWFSCQKEETVNLESLKSIYKSYINGEIDQCKLNDAIVFCAGLNTWDAPAIIYNNNGKIIGLCNYAWGPVDEICKQLTDCEVIYRCEHHISGQPSVDKYNLGN